MTIGIDEVGRGAWAGPLVVGAVAFDGDIDGLVDSKVLNRKQREDLSAIILSKAEFVGIGWVDAREVDELGLTAATTLACVRALDGAPKDSAVIIDGSVNYLPARADVTTQVKADATVPAVSAASIVAKVARDQFMSEQALVYKNYGFESHVGYGTKLHIESLKKLGISPIHRRSYKPIAVYC